MPDDLIRAAGVLFVEEGNILILERADGSGWALPGGRLEDGETAEEAARRECEEEIGFRPEQMFEFCRRIKDGVDFTTFITMSDEWPSPTLNDEHTNWKKVKPVDIGDIALHPGMGAVLTKLTGHELDVAKAIRDGELTSPTRFENMWLFDIRITGTGHAYRTKGKGEFVRRDPEIYLNDEFLARCNGLPVIFEHPEKSLLTSDEYSARNVGSVFLPYIKGEEVWAIAKIYDDSTAQILMAQPMSTSPGVKLRLTDQDIQYLDDGEILRVETSPKLLDHIAICDLGVWDKAGDPRGIISEGASMADEAEVKEPEKKADTAEPSKMDAFMDSMNAFKDAMCSRMDALEAKKADVEKEDPEQLAADKAKKDSEDAEKEKAEKDKADRAKADAERESIKEKLDELDGRTKDRSDADMEEMADAQSKFDNVAMAFGDRINSRPMIGETPIAYRARLANKLKEHSPKFKDKDMSQLARADADVFAVAEEAVYADAMAAASAPGTVPAGQIREVRTTGPHGHIISEFKGDIDAVYGQFRLAPKRVSGIQTKH